MINRSLVALAAGAWLGALGMAAKSPAAQDGAGVKASVQMQLWTIYSPSSTDTGRKQGDDRLDVMLRRGRLGLETVLRPRLSTKVWFAYDNLGRDARSTYPGNGQNEENQQFYLWDAQLNWAIDSTRANLTIGYFRPQVVRESITSSMQLNSLEKGLPNTYTREHLVGRSSGRETGVNLGGVVGAKGLGGYYSVGWFDTNHRRITGVAGGGTRWSPLTTARAGVWLGEPEMKMFSPNYAYNYFRTRRGMTVSLDYTHQGRTDETVSEGKYYGGFQSNRLWGADVLANWGGWTVSAEYYGMERTFSKDFRAANPALIPDERYTNRVWVSRVGYTFVLGGEHFWEPVAMVTEFTGDRDAAVYRGGWERAVDVGVNWYLDRNNLKVVLHYVRQTGAAVSRYSATGKDRRGDFVAAGVQFAR